MNKKCHICKKRERYNNTSYCRECLAEKNRKYYQKNKKEIIKKTLERLKKTNYAVEKTEKQRYLRNIKRKTRKYFPLKNQKCEICGKKATERHHTTDPIKYDKFIFVCHQCHIKVHNEKKKKMSSMQQHKNNRINHK